jgi:hypothetical protein
MSAWQPRKPRLGAGTQSARQHAKACATSGFHAVGWATGAHGDRQECLRHEFSEEPNLIWMRFLDVRTQIGDILKLFSSARSLWHGCAPGQHSILAGIRRGVAGNAGLGRRQVFSIRCDRGVGLRTRVPARAGKSAPCRRRQFQRNRLARRFRPRSSALAAVQAHEPGARGWTPCVRCAPPIPAMTPDVSRQW